VDGSRALDLDEGLATIRAHAFSLTLHGVGFFPPRGEPRILWAGFEPSEPLSGLQRQIARVAHEAGCAIEKRKFHPHVTLARLAGASPSRIAAWLGRHATFRAEPFEVTRFQLMSSVLGKSGATHRLEREYELTTTL
jgi:2'-5' RNA ligase